MATHLGEAVVRLSSTFHLDPLVLGLTLAALPRIAVGSATAAGIVAPLASARSDISPELLVLATSSGAIILSYFNDSGFWLFKECFGLTVAQTLRSWTLLVTIQYFIGLAGVLAIRALISVRPIRVRAVAIRDRPTRSVGSRFSTYRTLIGRTLSSTLANWSA